jgi:hypothetical protein
MDRVVFAGSVSALAMKYQVRGLEAGACKGPYGGSIPPAASRVFAGEMVFSALTDPPRSIASR